MAAPWPSRRRARWSAPAGLWRRIAPVLLVLLLLALAPAFALAQGDSVIVRWTAPGDDGAIGTAAVYDLRVSESPLDGTVFDQATPVPGMPAPLPSGTTQSFTVHGLTAGRTYYFAIRTADDAGNWSPISNVVKFDWTFDSSPPSPPRGVKAKKNGHGVQLTWDPNTEADLAGYNVYRTVAGGTTTRINSSLLVDASYTDASSSADAAGATYDVTAVDVRGNESAHTAEVTLATATAWSLEPPFPNPSRRTETVTIPLVVPAGGDGDALVQIVDSAGRPVRRIAVGDALPGPAAVAWDGANDSGRPTAPGVYRAWLVAGSSRTAVRIVRVP